MDIKSTELKVLEQLDIGCAVTSLHWSPNYRSLALGSSKVGANGFSLIMGQEWRTNLVCDHMSD